MSRDQSVTAITLGTTPAAPIAGTEKRTAAWRVGEVLADRYRIDALLGEGGMGEVYAGSDLWSKREVALKVLSPRVWHHGQARLRADVERRALRRIQHPNVVQLLDWVVVDMLPVLVLERLHGLTLDRYVARSGTLSHEEALACFAATARGMAAVHAQGFVHRDVKPQNVFLVTGRDGLPREVKLLDFGLARTEKQAITGIGMLVGTPAYSAPEQVLGDVVDPRVDVYSLGLTMYCAIGGHHPFASRDSHETLAHQVLTAPPPLSWLREDVDPDLEALIARMLRKRPELRPSTADEVADELAALAARGRRARREGDGEPMAFDPDDVYTPRNPAGETMMRTVLRPKLGLAAPPSARKVANG
jgi:serine/threonine protein kinase